MACTKVSYKNYSLGKGQKYHLKLLFILCNFRALYSCHIYVGMHPYFLYSLGTPGWAINAWSSSVLSNSYTPMNGWATTIKSGVLFISKKEENPWVRFQLNRDTVITSITVVNRKDCCGQRLMNLEIRAGMENNTNNQVVGFFKGPGETNKEYTIRLAKEVNAGYISIQMKATEILQINGLKLNLEPIQGN